MNFIITLLVILVIVAIVYLILYLFQKWVMPVDPKITGVVLFIVFAALVIYALTGNSLLFWKN